MGKLINNYFTQPIEILSRHKEIMVLKCEVAGLPKQPYIDAFDYFCIYPSKFNGATGVNDLCDIRPIGFSCLDMSAMAHDYHYVFLNAGVNWKYKQLSDKIYAHSMRMLGKGNYHANVRRVGVFLAKAYFLTIARFQRGKMLQWQKDKMDFYKKLYNF
jgi:hypothetical protein